MYIFNLFYLLYVTLAYLFYLSARQFSVLPFWRVRNPHHDDLAIGKNI